MSLPAASASCWKARNGQPDVCCFYPSAIDEMARLPGCEAETANKVALKMFQDRITWKRIFVLLYVTGQLAVKVR